VSGERKGKQKKKEERIGEKKKEEKKNRRERKRGTARGSVCESVLFLLKHINDYARTVLWVQYTVHPFKIIGSCHVYRI